MYALNALNTTINYETTRKFLSMFYLYVFLLLYYDVRFLNRENNFFFSKT